MDNAARLQYLEAMGIDVWVSRHPPTASQLPVGDDELAKNVGWVDGCKDAASEGRSMDSGRAMPGAIAEQSETHPGSSLAEEQSFIEVVASPMPEHQPATPAISVEQAWNDLKNEVAACHACSLCETRTQTVFGVGNQQAEWLLIGEAPGQNEDLQGEPFVGRAGQLLNEMLRAIGLKREQVFIANMLKCRPPNNRDPQADEVGACHDFLLRQIELIRPKIILAVGRIAAQNLLKTQQPLAKLRGVQHRLENYPLVVVHHPAYLLRSLTEKAKAWDDLQFALSVYQSLEQ